MNITRFKSAFPWLTTLVVCAVAAVAILAAEGPSRAGSLVYTPTNPSFGGNPQNGPVLLNEANAQNLPLARQTAEQQAIAAANAASGSGGTSGTLTPSQIFAEQLQSQLLSSFANQITQAIFGPNAQTAGTFTYGTTTITFMTVASEIDITINDGTSTTTITVPANP